MLPDYGTNDPKGWCGNPRRGAAMGRPTVQEGEPAGLTGKMTLKKVKMCSCCGAYDENGTYFGAAIGGVHPLYWCAYSDDEYDVDFMLRAPDRAAAKEEVLKTYPNAKFYS